jgi:hypothetical protein
VVKMVFSRMDKDKIAGWRSSLDRTLQVFNVSIVLASASILTPSSQTELALSTNVIVDQTHDQVAEVNSRVQDIQRGIEEVGINPPFCLPTLIVFRSCAPDLHRRPFFYFDICDSTLIPFSDPHLQPASAPRQLLESSLAELILWRRP